MRFEMPAFAVGSWRISRSVGHRGLELLPDDVRLVDDADDPCAFPAEVDISRSGSRFLTAHPPRDRRPSAPAEGLAVARVEALGDVARELEVLALVVADRDDVGLVQEDVAGHQHRVREEPGRDELLVGGLVLELRHASAAPKLVTALSSQLASACAVTWLCAKTIERSGSMPVANSIAAPARVASCGAAPARTRS